jgi:hypothetical protein
MTEINSQSTYSLPDDLIEIRDPTIDDLQIIDQIRKRVQDRRDRLGYEQQNFPSFDGATVPVKPKDLPNDPSLYYNLGLANKSYYQFETEADVQPSPATRVPVLGWLWSFIRQQTHEMVLFYVNRNIRHQVTVNQQLVNVVNLLTTQLEEQQRKVRSLEKQLEALRSNQDGND